MKYEAEAEKLKEQHVKYQNKTTVVGKRLLEMNEKIAELEMKCYREGNTNCLAQQESFLIAILEINKKIYVNDLFKHQKCLAQVPNTLRPQSEFDWKINSFQALDAFKSYLKCARPHDDSISRYYDELHGLHEDALGKLYKFNSIS